MPKIKQPPQPRAGWFMRQDIINSTFPDGTWLEGEEFTYPSGGFKRKAWAVCEDGKRRLITCSIPDTCFTIPGRTTINRRRVTGFLTSDEQGLKFKQQTSEDDLSDDALNDALEDRLDSGSYD